jgi:hypothetical protein
MSSGVIHEVEVFDGLGAVLGPHGLVARGEVVEALDNAALHALSTDFLVHVLVVLATDVGRVAVLEAVGRGRADESRHSHRCTYECALDPHLYQKNYYFGDLIIFLCFNPPLRALLFNIYSRI